MALTLSQKAKKNYNYGKLVDNAIEYAPYYLVIGTRCYVNTTEERYLSQGWKRIQYAELSEEDSSLVYREVYSEDETTIYADWVLDNSEE